MNASRESLAMFLGLLLGLAPVTALGVTGASGPPPMEQALVPEGIFAVQLVEALKMGPVQDEAQAESQLSALGIEPKNGWIAGYPMTPPVMVEIEKGVAAAAEGGKLKVGKEEALKAVRDLKTKLGLNIEPVAEAQPAPKGSTIIYRYVDKNGVIHFTNQEDSIRKEYLDRVETIRGIPHSSPSEEPIGQEMQTPDARSFPSPGPEVVNNYYYDSGPPVVTYYPPPEPYYYLYSWVPYPFWWGAGIYCPGFFILHDFHRHVGFHGRPFVCTNHGSAHHSGFTVNPHTHRFEDSRMVSRVSSTQAFNSPKVQSSARAIVGLSQNRPAWGSVSAQPRTAALTSTSSGKRFQAPTRPNSPGVQGQPKITSPTSTPTVTRFKGPLHPSTQQRASNGMSIAAGNNSGHSGTPPTRTLGSPPSNGLSFAPSPPPRVASSAPAAGMHGPVYSVPAPSGRGSFGGVKSSGGFGSRGGSFSGSSRGGHR